jgi:hypothetical protein
MAKSKLEGNAVDRPLHYTSHPSGIEAIEVCADMGFCLGNAFKYLMRLDRKWDSLEDLKKSSWYCQYDLWKRGHDKDHPMLTVVEDEPIDWSWTTSTFSKAGVEQIKKVRKIVELTPGHVGRAMYYIWYADVNNENWNTKPLIMARSHLQAEIEQRTKTLTQ